MGCHKLIVAVDDMPLVRIFNDKNLEDIKNLCLLKCREKAMMYSFRAMHILGKNNLSANAASRYPAQSESKDVIDEKYIIASVTAALESEDEINPIITWERVREEAIHDYESQVIASAIAEGFPEKNLLDEKVKPFWRMRDDLYIVDGVIFKDSKMLVPRSIRQIVLEALHEDTKA